MISIETYRARIGSFSQKNDRKSQVLSKLQGNVASNQEILIRSKILSAVRVTVIVLLLVGLPASVNQVPEGQHDHHQLAEYIPHLYKTTQRLPKPVPLPLSLEPPEDRNFQARYKYGNKRQNGIKIVHWNKGSSYL